MSARDSYPDGAKKETEHLALTTRTALGESEPNESASNNTDAATNAKNATASNANVGGAKANNNENAAVG